MGFRLNLLYCLFFLLPGVLFSQLRVVKPVKTPSKTSTLGFGVGAASSVLYLTRNINNNNNAKGINFTLTYDNGNYLRGALEYTYYGSIDISPTWFDVRAQTVEFNVNVISKSRNKVWYFYPIGGISYNMFQGYFTGLNDYLNLASIYTRNHVITSNWIGFNLGFGGDVNFKNGAIYANFLKMRIGRTEGFNQLNIMDVFMDLGLRFYVKDVSLHKLFRGTRSRYSLSRKTPTKAK